MYYILVAGNGESSRANTEALMEDYYYAKGAEGTLVIAYEKQPTKSHMFAAQYAKENNKEVQVFCNDDAQTLGLPGVHQTPSTQPVRDAAKFLEGQDAVAFVLWSEEDLDILHSCINRGIPASNLCDGLLPLNEISAPTLIQKDTVDITVEEPKLVRLELDFRETLEAHIKSSQELLKRLNA
jgi:hypothetical protein